MRVRQCQLNFEMLKWMVAAELSHGRAGMPSCEIFLKFFARSSNGIQINLALVETAVSELRNETKNFVSHL